jgi:hypothetical protein
MERGPLRLVASVPGVFSQADLSGAGVLSFLATSTP